MFVFIYRARYQLNSVIGAYNKVKLLIEDLSYSWKILV